MTNGEEIWQMSDLHSGADDFDSGSSVAIYNNELYFTAIEDGAGTTTLYRLRRLGN